MFPKILVPLDGSKLAEQALRPALGLLDQEEGRLILLHIPRPAFVSAPDLTKNDPYARPQYLDREHVEAQEYLNRIKYNWRSEGYTVDAYVAHGDVASVILDRARLEQVDLIVMSTHGRSGISRWVLGSVTERVLSSAPCPVLAIRSEKPIRHVMVTLDGSSLAEEALAPALALAQRLGARVTLLQVSPEPEPVSVTMAGHMDQLELGLGDHLHTLPAQEADAYLQSLVRQQAMDKVVMATAVAEGAAAENILHIVESQHVDLIAMATHGRSGLSRWVYGSVTEKVLRNANRSMLVIRPRH